MNIMLILQYGFSLCDIHYRKYVQLCRSDCILQRRFPYDNISFSSGDIPDHFAKLSEIGPEFRCFGGHQFWGRAGAPNLLLTFINSDRH